MHGKYLSFLRDHPGSTHVEIEMELGIDYVTFKKARGALGERVYSARSEHARDSYLFYANE